MQQILNKFRLRQSLILPNNLSMNERKLTRRWLVGLFSVPLLGAVAAFAIAPQTFGNTDVAVNTVVETLDLPEGVLLSSSAEPFWQSDFIRKDDTLTSLLSRLNIKNSEAVAFFRKNAQAKPFASQLIPGRLVQSKTSATGELIKLQYPLAEGNVFEVQQSANGYQASVKPMQSETREVVKSAEIKSSLFAAMDKANIPDQIATQMAEIFDSKIDFNNDLRRGDRFNVVYDITYVNGEPTRVGDIKSVEFFNKGQKFAVVRYQKQDAKPEYYTPEGKSLRKSFVRSPLEFTRVSSSFNLERFHPILNRIRAHKGVDLSAPTGTRIKSPSDGVVTFVGQKSGYGNVIEIEHENNIKTVYGHLSGFAPDTKKGAKVEQGEVIGYVGMTGLATGPHLHYEFHIGNSVVDPMTVAFPDASPLLGKDLKNFLAMNQEYQRKIALLSSVRLASIE